MIPAPTYRVVILGDGTNYLVHVPGETKQEAVANALAKAAALHGKNLRFKDAERIAL